MAQSVKHPTLDLSSSLDLSVVSSSPGLGSTLDAEPVKKKKKKKKTKDEKKVTLAQIK